MRSDKIRPPQSWGQGGSPAEPIRVRGVEGTPENENRRLKWTEAGYTPTTEAIVFYEPTSLTPKLLPAGEEAWVIFRAAANRYEELVASAVTVYEFRRCGDPLATLFLDNAEIGEHEPGETAIVEQEGLLDCWELIGPAPQCKTGQCAIILGWKDECVSCYYLTPCGGGSPTFVRERHCGEWGQYAGKVVKLDGSGHEGCYTVAKAAGCFSVNEELTTEHIVDSYENCDGCGCYELTNCDDEEDIVYVSGDLATAVGQTSGDDSIGERVKYLGVCYTITAFANPCGAEPEVWGMDLVERIESCSACCYALTNCADEEDVEYYKLKSTDEINPADFLDGNVSNGRVIMLPGYICRKFSIPETCPEEGVIVGLPTILEEFDSCEECVITCWERCDAPGTFIRTYSDMGEVGPGAAVKRAEDGFCYTRETSPGTCGEPSIVEFTIETIIDEGEDSCEICQTPRVKLTPSCGSESCGDCEGGSTGGEGTDGDPIVTNNPMFFPWVGKYAKIEGECHFVEWTTEELTGEIGCVVGPFDSCAACAAAPSEITVIAYRNGGHKRVRIKVLAVCGEEPAAEPCPVEP